MGSIGVPEMVFIFVLALLIFGPKKLPELGRSLGKGLSEFRRASTELRSSLEREMHNIENEVKLDDVKIEEAPSRTSDSTADSAKDTETPTYDYDHEYYGSEDGSKTGDASESKADAGTRA